MEMLNNIRTKKTLPLTNTTSYINRTCAFCKKEFQIANSKKGKVKKYCQNKCRYQAIANKPEVIEYQRQLKLKRKEIIQEYYRKYYSVKSEAKPKTIFWDAYLKADKLVQGKIKKLLNIK